MHKRKGRSRTWGQDAPGTADKMSAVQGANPLMGQSQRPNSRHEKTAAAVDTGGGEGYIIAQPQKMYGRCSGGWLEDEHG
jgi:hypothetical protein